MEIRKTTPFLWFNNQAEEEAKLYCSIFNNSKIIDAIATFELKGSVLSLEMTDLKSILPKPFLSL